MTVEKPVYILDIEIASQFAKLVDLDIEALDVFMDFRALFLFHFPNLSIMFQPGNGSIHHLFHKLPDPPETRFPKNMEHLEHPWTLETTGQGQPKDGKDFTRFYIQGF